MLTLAHTIPVVVERCMTVDATSPVAMLSTAHTPEAEVPVFGRAYDEAPNGFLSYTVEFAPGSNPMSGWAVVDPTMPVYLEPVTGQEVDEDEEPLDLPLATWDTTGLTGGVYTIRLTVKDVLGNADGVALQTYYLSGSTVGSDDGGIEHSFDLAGGWTMGVGGRDGELSLDRSLFEIPSHGPAQRMSIHYSSLDTDSDGLLGTGWSSDLTQHLEPIGSDIMLWHGSAGSALVYTFDGSDWIRPSGYAERLVHDVGNGHWRIESLDGETLVFEDSGDHRLVAIEDRFGQALTLAWNGLTATATDDSGRVTDITLNGSGNITDVEDSAGRAWQFGYSSGTLTTVTDPLGAVTTITYGGSGITRVRRTRTIGVSDTIDWNVAWDGSKVETITDPLGTDSVVEYESGDVLVRQPAAGGSGDVSITISVGVTETTVTLAGEGSNDAQRDVTVTDLDGAGFPARVTTTFGVDSPAEETTVARYRTDPETGVVTREKVDGPNGTVTTVSTTAPGTADITTIASYAGGSELPGTITQTWSGGEMQTQAVEVGGATRTTTFDYDGDHQLIEQVDPDGTVTTMDYDAHGNLVEEVADDGGIAATTTYDHDAAGNVIEEVSPSGMRTTMAHDALGRETRRTVNDVPGTSSAGDEDLTTRTWYDEMGWVVATEDANGTVTRYITDKLGRVVTTVTNCTDSGTTPSNAPASCAVNTGTHDSATNVVSEMTYDSRGNVTSETILQPNGSNDVVTTHVYDANDRLIRTTVDPGGLALITRYAYDVFGNQVATYDSRGITSRTFYDDVGNVIKEVRNCASTGPVAYPSVSTFGTYTCAATSNGAYNLTTTYAYDDLGRVVTEIGPNGRTTTTTYDEAGSPTQVIDNDVPGSPSGNEDLVTTTRYDSVGRAIGVRSPAATRTTFNVTATEYDDLGRMTKTIINCTDSGTTVPSTPACSGSGTSNAETNIVTTFTYDTDGRLRSTTAPDPSAGAGGSGTVITAYAYDGVGRLCRVLENAASTTALSSLVDPCSTTVSGTTSTSLSTRYRYDKVGNLVWARDAEGNVQEYAFDRLGRMTERTDGLGNTEVWAYDVRGNRTGLYDRIGVPVNPDVTWAYDKADRMTSRTADSVTTSYAYDANGNMTSATVGSLVTAVTYDRRDRVKEVDPDDSAANTVYTYSFTAPTRTDPSGSYTFNLDKFGRTTGIATPYTSGITQSWRADGAPYRYVDTNGNTTERSYDTAGRLTRIKTWKTSTPATVRADITYTYNRAGMRLTEGSTITGASNSGTATFGYDPLGRLVAYGSPVGGASDKVYAWGRTLDRTGVTTDPSGTPATVTTSFDAADRPTTDSAGGTYAHDANGRMAARPGNTFVWDSLGRLTTVKDGSGNTIATYTYDALDRLRTKVSSGTTTRFRYVGISTAVAQVYNVTTSSVVRSYATDLEGTSFGGFTSSANSQVAFGTNGHHDTVWVADHQGNVARYYRFDPWGVGLGSSGSGVTPHTRWQGSYLDLDTGLYWVVTRWYAPAQGRFISEDSLLGMPDNPDSRHLYAYGEGDPIGTWDPDGRSKRDRTRSWWYFGSTGIRDETLLLSIFIAQKQIRDSIMGTSASGTGDHRGFQASPDCTRSRACITIRFQSFMTTVSIRVNHSCGQLDVPWDGFHCNDAHSIVNRIPGMLDNDNGLAVFRNHAVMRLRWNLKNSIAPAGPFVPAIDGYLNLVLPRGGRRGEILIANDHFPSLEMFHRRGSDRWRPFSGSGSDVSVISMADLTSHAT